MWYSCTMLTWCSTGCSHCTFCCWSPDITSKWVKFWRKNTPTQKLGLRLLLVTILCKSIEHWSIWAVILLKNRILSLLASVWHHANFLGSAVHAIHAGEMMSLPPISADFLVVAAWLGVAIVWHGRAFCLWQPSRCKWSSREVSLIVGATVLDRPLETFLDPVACPIGGLPLCACFVSVAWLLADCYACMLQHDCISRPTVHCVCAQWLRQSVIREYYFRSR